MSTRAAIGYQTENGLKLIYSHYDGYPSHVGKMLVTYHNTFEDAKQLTEGHSIRLFKQDGSVERFQDGDAFYAESVEDGIDGFDYLYLFDQQEQHWKCLKAGLSYRGETVENIVI